MVSVILIGLASQAFYVSRFGPAFEMATQNFRKHGRERPRLRGNDVSAQASVTMMM
jgi:hypothetical protein